MGLFVCNRNLTEPTTNSPPGYLTDYIPYKGREKTYDYALNFLQASEKRLARSLADSSADSGHAFKVALSYGDVAFLIEEAWRGRSVVTGVPTKLVLVRWRRPDTWDDAVVVVDCDGENGTERQESSNARLGDLACMTREEAARHEAVVLKEGRSPEDVYSEEVVRKASERMALAHGYEQHRC